VVALKGADPAALVCADAQLPTLRLPAVVEEEAADG